MDIIQSFLTKSDCYKTGKKITPKGIMPHSTGANNPKLSRYIQPDDGILGVNSAKNDWNKSGLDRCVHAFIGKDKNGNVRVYQTLPWNFRAWHCGGKANDTHISFEICEDGLDDAIYFEAVYNAAVDLCVELCKIFNLKETDILCHCEGFKKGIASNHADVMHWFSRHGKSMDSLRADVKAKLNQKGEELGMTHMLEMAADSVLRKEPTAYSEIVGNVPKGGKYIVNEVKGDWFNIGGWVHKDQVKFTWYDVVIGGFNQFEIDAAFEQIKKAFPNWHITKRKQ